MALETLMDVGYIDGFEVCDLDAMKNDHSFKDPDGGFDWVKYDEHRKKSPIAIAHGINTISFRIQQGPIKEHGMNGCQVDTMIKSSLLIIQKLNEEFPCRENSIAITKLQEALMWLEQRKKDRIARGVEGFYKE